MKMIGPLAVPSTPGDLLWLLGIRSLVLHSVTMAGTMMSAPA